MGKTVTQEIKIKISGLQNKQKQIFQTILNSPPGETKYWLVKATRQSGKTFMAVRLALTLAFKQDNQSGFFILSTNSQCAKVFDDFNKILDRLNVNIVEKKNNSNGSRFIKFCNGTKLNFYSAGACDSIAGNSADFAVFDEAALYTDKQFSIINPIFAAKKFATVLICSTPRGKNWFYRMWMDGLKADPFVRSIEMSYKDNKYFDTKAMEQARRTIPPELFAQEYLAQFQEGISAVFGDLKNIQKIKSYQEINQEKKHYFGLDISGAGADKTILTILDEDGNTSLIYECKKTSIPEQARELEPILKRYSKIVGYAEKNGLGEALCDLLIELKIKVIKWNTTNDEKQKLVSNLILAINEEQIKIPTFDLCEFLDIQMSQYIGVKTKTNKIAYTHPVGEHDDYVDSLMLANQARLKLISESCVVKNDTYNQEYYDEDDYELNY